MYEIKCDTNLRGTHQGPLVLGYQDGARTIRHQVPEGCTVVILPGAGGYCFRTGGHYDLAFVYTPNEIVKGAT